MDNAAGVAVALAAARALAPPSGALSAQIAPRLLRCGGMGADRLARLPRRPARGRARKHRLARQPRFRRRPRPPDGLWRSTSSGKTSPAAPHRRSRRRALQDRRPNPARRSARRTHIIRKVESPSIVGHVRLTAARPVAAPDHPLPGCHCEGLPGCRGVGICGPSVRGLEVGSRQRLPAAATVDQATRQDEGGPSITAPEMAILTFSVRLRPSFTQVLPICATP